MFRIFFILVLLIPCMLKGSESSCVKRFKNARLILDHTLVDGELWVKGGKIIPPESRADETYDVEGKILAPGLIDAQINGGFGCDFSRNPEKLEEVAHQLLQFGVTSFVPTVISSSPAQYRILLPQLQPGKKEKRAMRL